MLFLPGKSTRVQEQLAEAMAEASAAMEFERAAALRDRIRALTNVQANQGINPEGVEEADVVALHQEGGQACVQVFFIRAHQNWGNRAYFPRTGGGREPGEILEALPRPVLRQQDPAAADPAQPRAGQRRPAGRGADARSSGARWRSRVPQRGEKARLVEQAARNAREALARRMAESASQAALLEGLAEAFGLDGAAGADRGLRQQPHHGHERGRRHDRRRARGLPEVAVPQVQHPRDRARRPATTSA